MSRAHTRSDDGFCVKAVVDCGISPLRSSSCWCLKILDFRSQVIVALPSPLVTGSHRVSSRHLKMFRSALVFIAFVASATAFAPATRLVPARAVAVRAGKRFFCILRPPQFECSILNAQPRSSTSPRRLQLRPSLRPPSLPSLRRALAWLVYNEALMISPAELLCFSF